MFTTIGKVRLDKTDAVINEHPYQGREAMMSALKARFQRGERAGPRRLGSL